MSAGTQAIAAMRAGACSEKSLKDCDFSKVGQEFKIARGVVIRESFEDGFVAGMEYRERSTVALAGNSTEVVG